MLLAELYVNSVPCNMDTGGDQPVLSDTIIISFNQKSAFIPTLNDVKEFLISQCPDRAEPGTVKRSTMLTLLLEGVPSETCT